MCVIYIIIYSLLKEITMKPNKHYKMLLSCSRWLRGPFMYSMHAELAFIVGVVAFSPKLKDTKSVGGGCSGVEGGWLPDLRCMEEERAVRAGKH